MTTKHDFGHNKQRIVTIHTAQTMPTRPFKKVFKTLTSSRQRLLVLTLTLIVLLLASIGAIIAHQATTTITSVTETKYQNIPILAQQGQLIVGVDPNQPPFSSDINDQLTGYNIDLARSLSVEIGLPVSFKTINAADLEKLADPQSQLSQGEIHIVIANTTVTSARQQNFSVSNPYITVSQVGISRQDKPLITSAEQLQGKVIASLDQSLAAEYAQSKTSASKLVSASNVKQLVSIITNNQADIALIDLPTANQLVANNSNLRIATTSLIEEPYVILTAKSQWQLTNLINSSLTTLSQRGIMQSLQQKWLR